MGKKGEGTATSPEGEVLRWIRRNYLGGVRQVDLAATLGISVSYLANLEAGNNLLSEDKAREIAKSVARTPEDERDIMLRFAEALLLRRTPELRAELECRRLRPETKDGRPEWAAWAEESRQRLAEKGMTAPELADAFGEDPEYVAHLVAGEIMPPRRDVRRFAAFLGQEESRQMLLAGYLPSDALDLVDEVAMLLETERSGDERTKTLVRTVLRHASQEGTAPLPSGED